jgi:hypothetical protein
MFKEETCSSATQSMILLVLVHKPPLASEWFVSYFCFEIRTLFVPDCKVTPFWSTSINSDEMFFLSFFFFGKEIQFSVHWFTSWLKFLNKACWIGLSTPFKLSMVTLRHIQGKVTCIKSLLPFNLSHSNCFLLLYVALGNHFRSMSGCNHLTLSFVKEKKCIPTLH